VPCATHHEVPSSKICPPPGTRIARSKGGTAGLVALTLDGARGGRTAIGITWQFQDVNGAVLWSGSVAC
jgi:hypothetical protein